MKLLSWHEDGNGDYAGVCQHENGSLYSIVTDPVKWFISLTEQGEILYLYFDMEDDNEYTPQFIEKVMSIVAEKVDTKELSRKSDKLPGADFIFNEHYIKFNS